MHSGERLLPDQRQWTICIPVTPADVELLALTLPSVLAHSAVDAPILLLGLGVDLATWQQISHDSTRFERVLVPETTDPWQAALRELPPHHAGRDLLLLQPGIEVPPGWDTRLALAIDRYPAIAATMPLCDGSSLLSLLESTLPSPTDFQRIDLFLRAYSPRLYGEIPGLFSGCCYLRRDALRLLEPDIAACPVMTATTWLPWLAAILREHGWSLVACDQLYVLDHAKDRRRQEMRFLDDSEEARLMSLAHPLLGLRITVREFLERGDPPPVEAAMPKPVQLHVAHSWGGGLDYWIQQYCIHDQQRDNLVLRSIGTWGAFGQRISLYRSSTMDRPLRYWDLGLPIRATALTHLQYQAILRDIIAEFRVEAILVSSLIGHALDVLTTGLPTILLAHDYYPFCPAIVIHFNEVCHSCERERLAACFAHNEPNQFFRNVSPDEWFSLRRRFTRLAQADTVQLVAPAPSVAQHWQTLAPALRDKPFHVIPHGLDFAPRPLAAPPAEAKLRVVVLGRLAPQKGRALLEQLWPLIAARVDLYLVGCDDGGAGFIDQPGITVIPRYAHAELPRLLAKIQPEVGLLLSIWPETFSYTLSELWLFGLPVVATDLGSFADRIDDGVSGFLCAPTPDALAERLLAIAADRACLMPLRTWAINFRHRSVAEMIADYQKLIPLPTFSAGRYLVRPSPLPSTSIEPHALHVDTRVPFSEVLREFGEYAGRKLVDTPRLRPWQKRGLQTVLRLILRASIKLSRLRVKAA